MLAVIRSAHKYIIDNIDGIGFFSQFGEGASILGDDLYRTMTGRVLLAHLPECEALEVFESLGLPQNHEWDEVTDRESFLAELEVYRSPSCCWRVTKDDYLGFAVPVMSKGRCVCAIGLSVLEKEGRTAEEAARIIRLMKRCRTEAERRLAFEQADFTKKENTPQP